jgi:PAT family beta-lactamase induction signal transducer AmpG
MNKFRMLFSDRKMLIIFMLGFFSGLPLLLTGSTLQAWCKDSGMNLMTIGAFAYVGLPYTLKFLWAPLLDWITPTQMGRRRGWFIIAQIGLAVALLLLAMTDPKSSLTLVALAAVLVAFMSATFDIGVDAYQVEILPRESYALGNQFYVIGYRLGMLLASGGSLILADHLSFKVVYVIMAGIVGLGTLVAVFAREPKLGAPAPKTFTEAVREPIKDFFSANGNNQGRALWIIAFFLFYKFGCDMATSLNTVFYMDIGYTKTDIGAVSKIVAMWAVIGGGLVGGAGVVFLGIRRSLWVFGILQAVAILSFAWINEYIAATHNLSLWALGTSVGVEYFAAGMGTAAYGSYMASCVNQKYTATQYALLSSLMGLTRIITSTPASYVAQHFGWTSLFVVSCFASIPGLLVLWKLEGKKPPLAPQQALKVA